MTAGWDRARTIADAVLYEGYLLYPVPRQLAKEPVALAVRGAGARGRRRRRASVRTTRCPRRCLVAPTAGTRRSQSWCASCSCSTAASNAIVGGGRFEPVDELRRHRSRG